MNKLLKTCVTLATALVATACMNPGKVTGGGKVVDDSGKAIANFGMNADTCSGDLLNPRGQFNWVDQTNGVKMNGRVVAHGLCVSEEDWQGTWYSDVCAFECVPRFGYNTHVAWVNYRSTNPTKPGSGGAFVCLKDNGEGINKVDGDRIALFSDVGVYAGYSAAGVVKGNIQQHTCD